MEEKSVSSEIIEEVSELAEISEELNKEDVIEEKAEVSVDVDVSGLSILKRIQMIRDKLQLTKLVPSRFNESTNTHQFVISDILDTISKLESSYDLCSIYSSDGECCMIRIRDTVTNDCSVSVQMDTSNLLKNGVDINSISALHDTCKRILYQNLYNITVTLGTPAEVILSEEDFIICRLKEMLGNEVDDFLKKLGVFNFKDLSFETLKATYEVMKKDYEEKQKK